MLKFGMYIQIPLIIFGGLVFLFSFWRRLKEDYFENQIFTTGFYIFFFVFVGNLISSYFASSYWFWCSFVGVLIALGLASLRYKMRYYEILEAAVSALFFPIIFLLLYDGITFKHPQSFFAIAVIGLLMGLYYFLSMHYKKIRWYKSGRIGFSGVCVLAVFFICRAAVAVWSPSVVSLSPFDWLISGSACFLALLSLFNLTYKKS